MHKNSYLFYMNKEYLFLSISVKPQQKGEVYSAGCVFSKNHSMFLLAGDSLKKSKIYNIFHTTFLIPFVATCCFC